MQGNKVIRMLESNVVVGDRVLKKGEVASVEVGHADKLLAEGRAAGTVLVKATRNRLVGTVHRVVGEEYEVTTDGAVTLHNNGLVTIVDTRGQTLAGLATPLPTPKRPAPPDPFAGEPPVKIKATRQFLASNRVIGAGETAEIPESIACKAVASGAAEFTGVKALTDRGKRYLESLGTKLLAYVPEY